MKQVSAYEPDVLAQLTGFERFLIIHKQKLIWASFLTTLLLPILIFGPGHHGGMRKTVQSSKMQAAHAIGLALYSYAADNDGKYPEGKSSTEICQELLDEQYIADPSVFYFSMPGKTKATSKKLKPENICWDFTDAVGPGDPDSIPLTFSTGFKVDYVAGGKAHFLGTGDSPGMAAFFKSNFAAFLMDDPGGIPLFPPKVSFQIVPTFDPKGKTYRQLTPEGPIP